MLCNTVNRMSYPYSASVDCRQELVQLIETSAIDTNNPTTWKNIQAYYDHHSYQFKLELDEISITLSQRCWQKFLLLIDIQYFQGALTESRSMTNNAFRNRNWAIVSQNMTEAVLRDDPNLIAGRIVILGNRNLFDQDTSDRINQAAQAAAAQAKVVAAAQAKVVAATQKFNQAEQDRDDYQELYKKAKQEVADAKKQIQAAQEAADAANARAVQAEGRLVVLNKENVSIREELTHLQSQFDAKFEAKLAIVTDSFKANMNEQQEQNRQLHNSIKELQGFVAELRVKLTSVTAAKELAEISNAKYERQIQLLQKSAEERSLNEVIPNSPNNSDDEAEFISRDEAKEAAAKTKD